MMSNRYEELGPRNKLSSNPSPLIQIDGKPLAPEVSVLFDKDKVQVTCNEHRLSELSIDGKLVTNCKEADRPSNRTHNESYSAWKTKNNQIYSVITGNADGFNKLPLRSSSSGSLRQINYDSNSRPTQDGYIVSNSSKELTNKRNSRLHEQHVRQPDGYSTRDMYNSDNRFIHCNGQLIYENDEQYKISTRVPQISGNRINYKGSQEREKHLCHPVFENSIQYSSSNSSTQNSHPTDSQENNQSCKNNEGITNNCECGAQNSRIKTNCSEEQEKVHKKDKKYNTFQSFSALDLSQINSQIIDLHNIIHHQNEQILILKQQMLEIHYDCLKRSQQNVPLQTHLGNYRCSQESDDRKCLKDNCHHERGFIDKRSIGVMTVPAENDSVSKRSIGIMTVPVQYTDMTHSNVHVIRDNTHLIEPMKKQNLGTAHGSLVQYTDKQPGRKKIPKKEERKKTAQDSSSPSNKKKSKEQTKNRRENSFSLNEAEILIRTSVEEDDISPNNSVHVDMQEYYSSSTDSNYSDTSESCSEDESQSRSDLDIESTGPQFGHTFYNLVVDQVNKIVRPIPPNKEQVMGTRRIVTDHGYGINEGYGMENNWSKRVTFDGPPIEDSDHQIPNVLHVPKHNYQKQIQDYRGIAGGVPDRMKDLLLYNIADGSTNLSIASLRYLERYNLPSSQPAGKKTGLVAEEQHSRKYKKKKKKKSPVADRESNMHQQYYNKKFNATSSKLLDITALKQQPKLF